MTTSKKRHNEILLFLGIGQDARTAAWVKTEAPWIREVIEPINYLSYGDVGSAEKAAEKYVRRRVSQIGAVSVIIAESQAVPLIVTMLRNGTLPYPEKLILLEPLGCNFNALGSTSNARYRSLMQRSKTFWQHPNQSLKYWGNRRTLHNIVSASLPNITKVKRMYTWGANQNITGDLEFLAEKIDVHIIAAIGDSLFPYHEIVKEIGHDLPIKIHRVKGTHYNRATKAGIEQLENLKNLLL